VKWKDGLSESAEVNKEKAVDRFYNLVCLITWLSEHISHRKVGGVKHNYVIM